MDIWHIDSATGELLGFGTAEADPVNPDNWLLPAGAVTFAPPSAVDGYARVFAAGSWMQARDHRGETWWTPEREAVVITQLGDPAVQGLVPVCPPPPIADRKAQRIGEAWVTMQARLAAASVSVTTGAGTHQYGLDAVTQDNLQKALLGVLAGLSPSPRPWTPKGASSPISITHDEVKAIAGAVGLAYEAHVQGYLAHKRALVALTTLAAVDAYDLGQGWPES